MAFKRPFSELDWHQTPEMVRHYVLYLERTLHEMQQRVESHEKRIETLEAKSKKNSHNSSEPPSSDPSFARKKRKQKKSSRAKGVQKGHEPNQQQVLDPTESHWLMPERCTCGHTTFDRKQMQPFYVHQHVELPKIKMEVSHFILQQCDCSNCGKTVNAKLPLWVVPKMDQPPRERIQPIKQTFT
jgi:transposase